MITISILLDSFEKVQNFVTAISRYSGAFEIASGNSYVDAKSLMGICSLNISVPLHLVIYDNSEQLEDILRDLQQFMV